jgi:hypothetical protein
MPDHSYELNSVLHFAPYQSKEEKEKERLDGSSEQRQKTQTVHPFIPTHPTLHHLVLSPTSNHTAFNVDSSLLPIMYDYCPSEVLKRRVMRVPPDSLHKFQDCKAKRSLMVEFCPDCDCTLAAIDSKHRRWTQDNQEIKWIGINQQTRILTMYEGPDRDEAAETGQFSVCYEAGGMAPTFRWSFPEDNEQPREPPRRRSGRFPGPGGGHEASVRVVATLRQERRT